MDKQITFGAIPRIAVGTVFSSYAEMNAAGVHRSTMGGISGRSAVGADSIVLSGGYEDDIDEGDVVVYTGSGGRDASGRHVSDQTLTRFNLALTVNEREGHPIRLIRGKDTRSRFAPASGYRYDGLVRVTSHWHEKGKSGFMVWRFRLEQITESTGIGSNPSAATPTGNFAPQRVPTTIQRIIRDTKVGKAVKAAYDYKCQVCGVRLDTGAGPYAEAAHVRPLGQPHNGPDVPQNVICLCPNHHVLFDLGAFSVADDYSLIGMDGRLAVGPDHGLDSAHLRYHREHYFQKK